MPFAYQVRRSEFDEILIRNAAATGRAGHRGLPGARGDFCADDGGATVHAQHEDGRIQHLARALRGRRLGPRHVPGQALRGIKRRNPKHNSAAMYAHFTGATPASGRGRRQHHHLLVRSRLVLVHSAGRRRHQHRRRGLAALPEDARTKPRQGLLPRHHRPVPGAGRAPGARDAGRPRSEATGNFSYACDRTHGANYLLLGDAYAFIDPVFSSGVMLAMQSGFVGARNGRHLPARSGSRGRARWQISTGSDAAWGPRNFPGSSIA